jgi:hypothetical protein
MNQQDTHYTQDKTAIAAITIVMSLVAIASYLFISGKLV